ncbi:TlpA family protein disulfide reductase [Marinobacterium mangrovicola]|uniref:Thiol-disulfide isomerase/thioredoxin n=1 Tax=Marinobacterium mangrovicola TaxID=1476959 RepID=A0A4R1GP46_9GAMM|nr:TlpA disulfide reductase family protein [Marinobacterium mangrovicola]TCK09060.1 thiol-disulfide isomerase/thioredoxin [Marinobacterium mangrovicola]
MVNVLMRKQVGKWIGRSFATLMLMSLPMVQLAHAESSAEDSPELYGLEFSALDGSGHSFAQHRGEVVLVNFWATWCPPCVREMPALDRLQSAFEGKPFSVVAISAGEQPEDVQGFLDKLEQPLELTLLLDPEGRTFREFKLRGLPMSYLFSSDGELIEVITGEEEWDSEAWQNRIEELLPS